MKFTKRTYKRAIKYSISRECVLFNDHYRAFRGPDAWMKQIKLTEKIKYRMIEEGYYGRHTRNN